MPIVDTIEDIKTIEDSLAKYFFLEINLEISNIVCKLTCAKSSKSSLLEIESGFNKYYQQHETYHLKEAIQLVMIELKSLQNLFLKSLLEQLKI